MYICIVCLERAAAAFLICPAYCKVTNLLFKASNQGLKYFQHFLVVHYLLCLKMYKITQNYQCHASFTQLILHRTFVGKVQFTSHSKMFHNLGPIYYEHLGCLGVR